MFISFLYYIFITLCILLLTLVLVILSVIIFVRLKYERLIKGVCKSKARIDGKIALVTGGNSGIGLETARDLARRGARVIIACRDAQKSSEAVADIERTTGNRNVEFRHLDLSKFSSVRKFADVFNKSYDRLDILVNNAGCAGLTLKPSEDGVDKVMQINYFGPFLLTNLLLDKVIASKPSRIIIVSSTLHKFANLDVEDLLGMNEKSHILKYANSKLCDILWMKALAKRLPEGVTINALHPGVVKTNIFRSVPYKKLVLSILDLFFKTPKEGAQTTLHLCVDESLGNVSGKYFVDCKEDSYNKAADDEDLVEKVWNKSLALTS